MRFRDLRPALLHGGRLQLLEDPFHYEEILLGVSLWLCTFIISLEIELSSCLFVTRFASWTILHYATSLVDWSSNTILPFQALDSSSTYSAFRDIVVVVTFAFQLDRLRCLTKLCAKNSRNLWLLHPAVILRLPTTKTLETIQDFLTLLARTQT